MATAGRDSVYDYFTLDRSKGPNGFYECRDGSCSSKGVSGKEKGSGTAAWKLRRHLDRFHPDLLKVKRTLKFQ